MKIIYGGPILLEDFFQRLYQDATIFKKYHINFARSVNLFMTPCDEHGEPYAVYDEHGRYLHQIDSRQGPYRPAADFYNAGGLEPEEIFQAPAQPKFRR